MSQWFDWLSMGGYAVYVWSAYGVVLTGLVINLGGIYWQGKQIRLKLKRWFS